MGKKQEQNQPPPRQLPLPAWYYRVLGYVYDKDRGPYPEEFDEDISDIKEKPETEHKKIKQYKDEGNKDEFDESDNSLYRYESDRSYDGSDADYYYEFKELREDRKHQLVKIREEEQKLLDDEKRIVEKVKAVERSQSAALEDGQKPPPLSIADRHFKIYSTDYAEYFGSRYWSMFVDFNYLTEDCFPEGKKPPPGPDRELLYGQIYIHGGKCCDFKPFVHPEQTDLQRMDLESDGEPKLKFTLKVLDNDHLLFYVPRDYIFEGESRPKSLSAPEMFEFVGIRHDFEKARRERLEKLEMEKKRKRSPSPRESFFTSTHPWL